MSSVFNIIADIRQSEFSPACLDKLTLSDLEDLVNYLKVSHDYYTQDCFPKLHAAIHELLDECEAKTSCVMNRFFDEYEEEVCEHFRHEDEVFFPYAFSLVRGDAVEKMEIADETECHSRIEVCMRDMKMLVLNHIQVAPGSLSKVNVLSFIFRMEEDIHKHAVIEEKLFFPLLRKFSK